MLYLYHRYTDKYLGLELSGFHVGSLLLVVITSSNLSHRQPPQLLYPFLTHESLRYCVVKVWFSSMWWGHVLQATHPSKSSQRSNQMLTLYKNTLRVAYLLSHLFQRGVSMIQRMNLCASQWADEMVPIMGACLYTYVCTFNFKPGSKIK